MNNAYIYSVVVDDVADHAYKAEILLLSLERFAGVPKARIIVHCTTRVTDAVRQGFARAGYGVNVIAPYLDGKYCNKLRQLDYFVTRDIPDLQGVFLLDLDMAVLAPLDIADPETISGKIVDAPNPPLPVLQRIFAEAGLTLPATDPCDWGDGETVGANFNGGLYYLPLASIGALRDSWLKFASFLFANPHLFDDPHQRNHIDQVSFALALTELGLAYRHVSANWNFPAHNKAVPSTYRAGEPLRVLHYHKGLDQFGLIAPVHTATAAVTEAVDRVNDAIAAHDELVFFLAYRRHLAARAAKGIPHIAETPFSADFVARTRIGDKKRRLILHAGTPKTGTSSLQWTLGTNRGPLAEMDIWYPEPSDPKMPKHQQLVGILMRGEPRLFADHVESALRGMPEGTHTIIFTTEGIFNHWWDYPPQSKSLLRHLAHLFDFELWVWFREPVAFAAALYIQCMKNPQQKGVTAGVYGCDISLLDALNDPWFQRHLDYLGFYYETQELFGQEGVRGFLYEGDTVAKFLSEMNIQLPRSDPVQQNISLRTAGLEIMRTVNQYPLGMQDKNRIEILVHDIDRIVGDRAGKFQPSPQEKAKIDRHSIHWNSFGVIGKKT